MDPITHAASGAVAMLAMPHRPASRWAVPLAALAAASPDIDVVLANTPLQFLLLHRGITHSLFAAPLLGLVLALAGCALWRAQTPGHWRFAKAWIFMTAMAWLHIWLDCVTTYGTMIFLPFSPMRVRLNAVFIIDLLLTLPLLWAIWRWRARRGLMLLAAAWVFVYPGLSIGLNVWHTAQTRQRLAAEGRTPQSLVVLPDAFAPLFWRAIYTENGPNGSLVHTQGLTALGSPHGAETSATALTGSMAHTLARQSVIAEAFLQFSLLPVVAPLPPSMMPEHTAGQATAHAPEQTGILSPQSAVAAPSAPAQSAGDPAYLSVYDLRFGSNLDFVRKIMSMRSSADAPFRYMAELAPAPSAEEPEPASAGSSQQSGAASTAQISAAPAAPLRLVRERLRFSNNQRDSLWHPPRPPTPSNLLQWFVGLR